MKKVLQSENGSLSIESVISLTFFMLAIIAIMFIAMIVKVQSTMQYALSQTAKEISGYYYLLDKTGLTKLASGTNENADAAVENVNTAIADVIDFSQKGETTIEDGKKTINDANSIVNNVKKNNIDLSEFQNLTMNAKTTDEDFEKLSEAANTLAEDFETLSKDPSGQLKGIFSVFAKTMINQGLSYYIAPHVCRAIMPRYLAGDKEKSDKMLEAMGVTSLDKLDFSQTQLLADGRSIKLVVMYKINPEKVTLGFVKLPEEQWPIFRQTACTAAWIFPDEINTYSVVTAYTKPAYGVG